MHALFRILSILAALFFLWSGANWVFAPDQAAKVAEMPLLQGIAASSQIADIGAFFLSVAFFLGYGQLRGKSHWFYAAAFMLFIAAVVRFLAWAQGYADFATAAVIAEIVMLVVFVIAAQLREDEG